MKTKAAVLRNIGGPLVIEELEIPKLAQGQVLVKIFYSGLCRSQINEINGRKGREFIPHLLGHEASGGVVEVGEGVTKVKSGDYVVCSWIKGGGLDVPVVKYESTKGVVNAGAVATFSDYAVISENRLVRISKEISPNVAALLGCAVPTGAGIVDRLGAGPKSRIAVFGVGGIGASALLRANSLGMNCVAVDLKEWKLVWVENLGLNIKAQNVSEFNGLFDFTIECSGSKAAMETAFNCLKNTGMAIIAGNLEPGEKIFIDPFELVKGKKLRGTWGGECFLDEDVPFYALEFLKGNFPIQKLVTEIYSFDQINQGLQDLEEGKLIRGVVRIS
ncbi:MAG: alcohol dehydrogenase catalytic domain-containing protein [Candidatus Azambacteria bacterium]|nr:alcohol dehydrogenase catalytic domain-containing protein [Candidatus Azambacteria bacterium]